MGLIKINHLFNKVIFYVQNRSSLVHELNQDPNLNSNHKFFVNVSTKKTKVSLNYYNVIIYLISLSIKINYVITCSILTGCRTSFMEIKALEIIIVKSI